MSPTTWRTTKAQHPTGDSAQPRPREGVLDTPSTARPPRQSVGVEVIVGTEVLVTETLPRRAVGSYLAHPERVAADLLDVALLGINLPGTADPNRAILQAVATIRGWRPEPRLDHALAALAVPTLFACGARRGP